MYDSEIIVRITNEVVAGTGSSFITMVSGKGGGVKGERGELRGEGRGKVGRGERGQSEGRSWEQPLTQATAGLAPPWATSRYVRAGCLPSDQLIAATLP